MRSLTGPSESPRNLRAEEFFQEEAGKAAAIVADDGVFLEEIVEDDAEAELLEGRNVGGDRFGALRAIAPRDFGRNGLAIGDDPIDDAAGNVFLDGAEMIGKGVAGSFAGLGHQVGDVHARGFGLHDGAGNFRDQQIRENAGVKRAGAEQNQIRFFDGFDGQGKRTNAAGGKLELFDGGGATGSDARFAVNGAAVLERGNQMDVGKCRRKNAAFERATMQLRMSPGGRMRFSRRRRPELPPSSVTVTMAARSAMGRWAVARSSVRRMTSSLRPRRSVERPVPPPRATTRKPGERVFDLDGRFFMVTFGTV